jgi:hypothetical protein
MENKKTIYSHRAYRRLFFQGNNANILRFIALCVPFVVLVILFASEFTRLMSEAAKDIFMYLTGTYVIISEKPTALFGKMYLVDFMGRYPTPAFSAVFCVLTFGGIWLLAKLKQVPRSVTLYASFVLLITFISSVIFLFFPNKFPYNIMRFSGFYIATEIGIWLIIPFVMAASLSLLPSNIFEQYLVIAAILVYSLIFGFVRYILFLYVIHKFSYIFMATMFIAFDPPLDTVYIVGIYSLYACVVSKRMQGNQLVWTSD